MDISGPNIPTGLAARTTTAQQSYAAKPPAQKNRQTDVLPATDQYRPSTDAIIDAEYVDLYSPIRRPPEQPNQWRNLLVEENKVPEPPSTEAKNDNRNQQIIARYGQNTSDFPFPGSFVNLLA